MFVCVFEVVGDGGCGVVVLLSQQFPDFHMSPTLYSKPQTKQKTVYI